MALDYTRWDDKGQIVDQYGNVIPENMLSGRYAPPQGARPIPTEDSTMSGGIKNPYGTGGGKPGQPADEYTWGVKVPKYSAPDNSQLYVSDKVNSALGAVPETDTTGLNAYRNEALRTGPSRGSMLAMDKVNLDSQMGRDRAAQETAGSAAGAMSKLAMGGGLSSGARERVARSAVREGLGASQNIGATAASNRLQIGMNDESNRMNALGNLGQVQNQYSQVPLDIAKIKSGAAGTDAMAYYKANQDLNQFNADKYKTQMGLAGAEKTAQATAASGGSSFICTALHRHGLLSLRERKVLTDFMLDSLLTRGDFFAWYFKVGEKAIQFAERQNFNWSEIKKPFVDDIILTLKTKGIQAAQDEYIRKAGKFCIQFLGINCGYSSKMSKRNLFRSFLGLPIVFSLPQTYRWGFGYLKLKLTRKIKLFNQRMIKFKET